MSEPVAPIDQPEEHLEGLQRLFLAGIGASQSGDFDRAVELFQQVLRREPRLAEPRIELGRLHMEAGRLDDAEEETREALRLLEAGGQWVEDLEPDVLLSVVVSQLAEVLRLRADTDAVIFGDPAVFKGLLRESQQLFDRARTLDPSNEHAGYHAFFLGLDEDEPVE